MNVQRSFRWILHNLQSVRVAAVDTSLWSLGATLTERVRHAVNSAISKYGISYQATYTSIYFNVEQEYIAIPSSIRRILEVRVVGDTGHFAATLSDAHVIATHATTLMKVDVPARMNLPSSFWIHMDVEGVTEFVPPEVALAGAITPVTNTVSVTPSHQVASYWNKDGGTFELYATNFSSSWPAHLREIVTYNSIDLEGFNGFMSIFRGAYGTVAHSFPVEASVTISPIIQATAAGHEAILLQAEANMYNYWVGHRAQYDRYTAVSGIQQMDPADILAISRTFEKRAEDLMAGRQRTIKPGKMRQKVRNDNG